MEIFLSRTSEKHTRYHMTCLVPFFTVRCYASKVYVVIACLSVRSSQARIVLKELDGQSSFFGMVASFDLSYTVF